MTQLAAPIPAVKPLYGPSLEAQRLSKEKERERMTLRQRRLGRETGLCIPSLDDEDEPSTHAEEGGLLFLKGKKGLRTRIEEAAAGFSTF